MKLVQRDRAGRFARIWADTSDIEGEHWCHEHPLGSIEKTTYWCGHNCTDAVCRKYYIVWLLTHPRAVVRKVINRPRR